MPLEPLGIPFEFILFGLTLVGVAVFHHRTLLVALCGLAAICLYKLLTIGFDTGPGVGGLVAHFAHEWVIFTNLFALLTGFALLARHFEDSQVPERLPHLLPDDWRGGFVLLLCVFVLSAFLDNIAAAIIGGSAAATLYRNRVHIGYLAAIVAAANAGGAGSVIGDTTTTMMWIEGVPAVEVLHAYIAAGAAMAFLGVPAALAQQRYQPITREDRAGVVIDGTRIGIVFAVLALAVSVNVLVNLRFPGVADRFPFLGAAVWAALLFAAPLRRPAWDLLPSTALGSLFLLALVACASLMPVEKLPAATWPSTLSLGFLSAVFDNIPLTKLALDQGGYDWGFLAYAVGFGGSITWFGSSAGVAISNRFPEARSVVQWVRHGWFVLVGYVVGFFVLLAVLGWHPSLVR
jgi:Na+/H+ antiporter NhaD/arsenite permease-like protein